MALMVSRAMTRLPMAAWMGDFEHLARNQFAQAGDQVAAALVGLLAVADQGERVHRLAADQHVELHQIGFAIARQVVIERSVAARNAFQPVVEIEDDFVERHFVGEHDARGRKIFEILLHAALFLAECRMPPTDSSEVMIMAVRMGSSIF